MQKVAVSVKKLILVSSEDHVQHKYFLKVAQALKEKLGIDLELKENDYVYLSKYGETDELGLTWIPQLLAEMDNGEVIKVLTEPVLTNEGKLDVEGGIKRALDILLTKK